MYDSAESGSVALEATQRLHVFQIEARDIEDVLLRVLGPFARASADLRSVVLRKVACGVAIRIEAYALSNDRATTLAHRLRTLPCVATVGLGWRNRPSGEKE